MTTDPRANARQAIQDAVARTPECLPLERLGEVLSATEQRHLDTCARCQTELALRQAFEDAEPSADEGAAVQWIVTETRRRRAQPEAPAAVWGRPRFRLPRYALALSAAAVLLVAAYVTWDREPGVGHTVSSVDQYRSTDIKVVSPTGDVTAPPTSLVWTDVPGAARYDVTVLEVDQTVLWRARSSASRVALPASLVTQFVPGKTVLWQVSAAGASGGAVARSSTVRFRVVPR